MTQKGESVTLTLYSSPKGRYHHPQRRRCCRPLSEAMQPFYTTRGASRAPFYNLRRSRYHNPRPERPSNLRTLRTFGAKPRQPSPLNLLNLLNPLNPHARKGVSKKNISKKQLTQRAIRGIIILVAARAAAPRSSSSKTFQKMLDRRY